MQNRIIVAVMTILMVACGLNHRLAASPVKSNEEVVLFPVSASRHEDGSWRIPVHVWVFQREGGLDDVVLAGLARRLGIKDLAGNADLFAARAMWFTVDSERRKDVLVEMGDQLWRLNRTRANGHSTTDVTHPGPAPADGQGTLTVRLREGDTRRFSGTARFIPPTGLSVISDIDDTIKLSNVLDKQALLRNSFLKEYQPAPGMPEIYAGLKARGGHFHYVSASPWQLWPSLQPFIAAHYPPGTVAMRNFRFKDSSFADFLLASSRSFKTQNITAIIERYPSHKFILIGDSGECDPEIYGDIHRRFPDKVERIMIRRVAGSDFSDGRFAQALRGMARKNWQLVGEAASVGKAVCDG